MRSKKAKEYIDRHIIYTDSHGDIILGMSIDRAVELAESEMIEKAVEAFKECCDEYKDGECLLSWGIDSEKKCPGTFCATYEKFTLKLK